MRTYGEAIEVRTVLDPSKESAPLQFLWRGRLYVVRAVLAHWIELGAWWAGSGSRRRRPVPAGGAVGPGPRGPAPEEAEHEPRSVAFDVGAVEREVWRVEARAGRSSSVGVYDLVRDVPAARAAVLLDGEPGFPLPARWRLARTLD